ncbi:MAG TPA: glycosyltransferase family 4 protein [Pyrinomonadaceae bacterium]|nr:glycosyltransferase family 4 protein [Pyrinomonadaceae bacterium]
MEYVCAFRGRRDYYQAPLALSQAGLLDEFITDAYAMPLLRFAANVCPLRLKEKIQFRYEPRIPNNRVQSLWGTTIIEHAYHRLGRAPSVTFAEFDPKFSLAAANRAARRRTNLFLYSPYAWEAFVAPYSHTPHKVMFQYHPHPDLEYRILDEDRRKYPFVDKSFVEDTNLLVDAKTRHRTRDAWRHADLILCASSFTKRSMLEIGVADAVCRIVPYGIDILAPLTSLKSPETFRVLFVGSGTQRKGLHHLVLAWRRAALPKNSKLTVICRTADPGIEALVNDNMGIDWIRGCTGKELTWHFLNSSLLAMPSLVEGFGQVFLEALALGCPVLGTPNSCLPDLGDESEGIYLTAPGNIEELAARLEFLARILPGNVSVRTTAKQCAERFPWHRFRSELIASLKASV